MFMTLYIHLIRRIGLTQRRTKEIVSVRLLRFITNSVGKEMELIQILLTAHEWAGKIANHRNKVTDFLRRFMFYKIKFS
jgi:hypothetical protein